MTTIQRKWNFKFWKPVKCTGGNVRFWCYYKIEHDEDGDKGTTLQTADQFAIKADMGMFRGARWLH